MAHTQTAPSPKTEYPVSWTVRYQSSRGYDCMFTVRGETVAEVTRQAGAVLDSLDRCHPPAAEAPAADAPAQDPSWCAVHNVRMSRRERNGETWYSHKLAHDSWCRGK